MTGNIFGSILGGVLSQMMGGGGQQGGTQAALIQAVLAMLMGGSQGRPGNDPLSNILAGLRGGGGGMGMPGMMPGQSPGAAPVGSGFGPMAGGLGALEQLFRQAGMGQQMQSWVSTGPNQAVTPDEIARAFGSNGMTEIARAAGVSSTQAAEGLAETLPQLVNGITPNGNVADVASMGEQQMAGLMRQLFAQR